MANLLADEHTPKVEDRCLEYQYTKLGRWTYFSQWTLQMHHGINIMECVWQPCWILQVKVGISLYFWIIRLVNTQLSLYVHVRCNPLDTLNTPKHPWNTPNHPHMIITNFNYESLYLPCVICNIVVKADLGRCPGRCVSWSEWQFQMFTIRAHKGRSPGRSTST